jgi:hypothetical protein
VKLGAQIVVVSVSLLAACTHQPKTAALSADDATKLPEAVLGDDVEIVAIEASVDSEDTIYCKKVRRTGSFMRREYCVTRADSQRSSLEARKWLRSGGLEGSVTTVR